MSFPSARRPLYPSSLVLLVIVSLLHARVFCPSCTVVAVRIFPKSLGAVKEERLQVAMEAAPPGKNQTEIFQEYFRSRLSDVNSTRNDTFHDYKRRIPSCPDPLHN